MKTCSKNLANAHFIILSPTMLAQCWLFPKPFFFKSPKTTLKSGDTFPLLTETTKGTRVSQYQRADHLHLPLLRPSHHYAHTISFNPVSAQPQASLGAVPTAKSLFTISLAGQLFGREVEVGRKVVPEHTHTLGAQPSSAHHVLPRLSLHDVCWNGSPEDP